MKKKIAITLIALSFLMVPAFIFAQIQEAPGPGEIDVFATIDSAINFIFTVILIAATGSFLFAAFTFITAGGNEDNIKKAKQWLIYAVIGIVVAVLARAIPDFIVGILN